MAKRDHIRNFSIIAHIDHGKSTLADRLIEMTGTLSKREMEDQILDSMSLERERGITIKDQAVQLDYKAKDGNDYILNLIDTPGHVDFTYEVSRALAACEGALLVIDATQGIEAQTLANVYLAMDHDLEIIPVINKIDLPSADVPRVEKEIEDILGIDKSDCVLCSAKTGLGVDQVLEAVVNRVPAPKGDPESPLQALIFDSKFDAYKGVMLYVRVVNGCLKKGMSIRLMATGKVYDVTEVGVFKPAMVNVPELGEGQVGFLAAAIKTVKDARVGDTITDNNRPAKEPLPGYRKATPMVYCGLYPIENSDYDNLRDALEKLQLNDASLTFELETSAALGFGFRCGFLGLLHLEIINQILGRDQGTAGTGIRPEPDHYRPQRYLRSGEDQRGHRNGGQPLPVPQPHSDRACGGTFRERHHHRAQGLCGAGDGTVPGKAGRIPEHDLPGRNPGNDPLCPAPVGNHLRLFRPAEKRVPGLCFPGL